MGTVTCSCGCDHLVWRQINETLWVVEAEPCACGDDVPHRVVEADLAGLAVELLHEVYDGED